MKRIFAGTAALAVVAASVIAVLATSNTLAAKNAGGHIAVSLCHRTGSVDGGNQHNGYDFITVDISSVKVAESAHGHDHHDQVGNGPGGDIIPSYTYTAVSGKDAGQSFTYPGKNLDTVFANGETGAQVLAAGCNFSQPEGPTVVEPVAPVVTQPTCDAPGNVALPQNTDGLVYTFDQETGVVTATAQEGYVIGPDAGDGWVVAEGGGSATFQVTLDAPPTNCGGTPPPPPPPPPPGNGGGTPPPTTGGGVTVTRQAFTV